MMISVANRTISQSGFHASLPPQITESFENVSRTSPREYPQSHRGVGLGRAREGEAVVPGRDVDRAVEHAACFQAHRDLKVFAIAEHRRDGQCLA
eukprot:4576338-Pyramimonas_sp.AAC.1